jgi:hypothetical protein
MRHFGILATLAALLTCGASSPHAAPRDVLNESPHYVGLDPATHACAVLTVKTEGWKIMGTYKSTKEAKQAMAGMKECQGQPV